MTQQPSSGSGRHVPEEPTSAGPPTDPGPGPAASANGPGPGTPPGPFPAGGPVAPPAGAVPPPPVAPTGPAHPPVPAATGAPGGAPVPQPGHAAPGAGPWEADAARPDTAGTGGPRRALRRWVRTHRRATVLLAAGVGAVVVVGVVAVATSIVSRVAFSPEKPVLAYLAAIEEGRAADALELAGITLRDGDGLLLTDEVYAEVADRPTASRVTSVVRRGKSAAVSVRSEQAGGSVSETFQVRSDGRRMLFFDRWVLHDHPIPELSVLSALPHEADAFLVDGVAHSADDGRVLVLPGTYTVELAPPEGAEGLITSDAIEVTVDAGSWYESVSHRHVLSYELTAEGVAAAESATADFLESTCLSGTERALEDCGFTTWPLRADEAENTRWAFSGTPTVEVGLDRGAITAEISGTTRATYEVAETAYRAGGTAERVDDFGFWLRFPAQDGALGAPEPSRYGYWD